MITIALEGTAHTAGVGILDNTKILADIRDQYTTETGGIIPQEAKKHHEEIFPKLIENALQEAKITMKEIDFVTFSGSPGLAPCLIATMNAAKELAKKHNKKIISVNHAVAHLSSGHMFCKIKNPVYVYAAGANTQIICLEKKNFRIFGETLDTGIGNALDKFGRYANLGFPAGPKIEELAKKGKYVELPYSVKGMDLVFSGIITHAINMLKNGIPREDLCYSIQETLFAMLTEVVERALAHTQKDEAVLIGGVGANKRLSEMLSIMCKERGATFSVVPLKYAVDNPVMIGYQGILQWKAGKRQDIDEIDINPHERTDSVNVDWEYT